VAAIRNDSKVRLGNPRSIAYRRVHSCHPVVFSGNNEHRYSHISRGTLCLEGSQLPGGFPQSTVPVIDPEKASVLVPPARADPPWFLPCGPILLFQLHFHTQAQKNGAEPLQLRRCHQDTFPACDPWITHGWRD